MLTIRLIGIGAAIAILLVAAGNSGQVGLSQGQPVRTLTGHTYLGHFRGVQPRRAPPGLRLLGPDDQAVGGGQWQPRAHPLRPQRQLGQFRGVQPRRAAPGLRLRVQGTPDLWMHEARSSCGMWPVAEATCAPSQATPSDVSSVAFSPDGRLLASGSYDNTIKLWEVASGRPRALPHGPHRRCLFRGVQSRRAAPGLRLQGRTIKLWEVASGREVRSLSGPVWSVAFSPDGRLLASTSGSLITSSVTIKLWEVATGREVRSLTLTGHTGTVWSVAFSPDLRLLASGSCGKFDSHDNCIRGEIKLWEVTSGREVRTLSGHTSWVLSVAFSPDGRLLASGSYDKTINLWDISDLVGR
jgi:dipeptidyl aminopeptidase/acylaminoacyl peptidase